MEPTGRIPPFSNELAHESSPYLLQHAHNPVSWFPWGERALEKAAEEDKLLIVSIGYSSCHWCHVMEHESFSDTTVAGLMNERFVSIKVDREERPDIDQIYMTAVQMMDIQGGWPLHCIALPDGRPVWGGTYLPRDRWMETLKEVDDYYRSHRDRVLQYASDLAEGIRSASLFRPSDGTGDRERANMKSAIGAWSSRFDREMGGMAGSPKFPMPVNLEFLLQAGVQDKDEDLLRFVETTLLKMARGGIYDQVGGGFARYSVDSRWKVPHFEKMLYDNAQLLSLYAHGLQVFGHSEFREVIGETASFLNREMLGDKGLYYSGLDADSEGVEGKFYVWERQELESILGNDMALFAEYFHIDQTGFWENGRYILYRTSGPEEFCAVKGLEISAFKTRVKGWKKILFKARAKRVRPGLDDKSLTTWNALTVSGLCSAARATGERSYLEDAIRCATAIRDRLLDDDHILHRNYRKGQRTIPGFLPDYAFFIAAGLDLFELTLDRRWFTLADTLAEFAWNRFFDDDTGLFFFNASGDGVLISHQTETQDNVIPSSNAAMAMNLFRLGHLRADPGTIERASAMTSLMTGMAMKYPGGFAAWGQLILRQQHPFYEIVVVGQEAERVLSEIAAGYLPGAMVAGSREDSDLPLFRNRFSKEKTHIFVCRDNVCRIPVESIEDAKRIYLQA